MRIKLLFAVPLMLLVSCAVGKATAQIPEDIVALAALHSEDYFYQSNVPFSMHVAENLETRVNQIRSSVELDLEDAAGELGAARKMLFQLDAARFAIQSGNPIRDAITQLNSRWENQEEVLENFSVDRFRNNFNKVRQNFDAAEIEEMREEPRQFIGEAWDEFAMPFLKKMDVKTLEDPVKFQFGLVQDVGYGLLTNTTEETLINAIVVINYEIATDEDYRSEKLVYYFPELAASKTVAVFSMPDFRGLSTTSEKNQRKFNSPLQEGEIKLSFDVYSENGKCLELQPEIRDGLRTQMDCLRSVFVRGAVYGSVGGDRMIIRKTTGSGRTLKVFFEDAGKTSINNAWNDEDRDDIFEPRSTAFQFRVSAEDDSDDRNRDREKDNVPLPRGEHGKEVEIGVPYTWRAGCLIKEASFRRGGEILYPVIE